MKSGGDEFGNNLDNSDCEGSLFMQEFLYPKLSQ